MRQANFYQLFHASPELFCEELSRRFNELDERLARMSNQVEELAEALQVFVRQDLPAARAQPNVTAWTYDAAMTNAVFDSVYEAELLSDGAKRWTNGSGRLSWSLVVPRSLQYQIEVTIADFVTPEAESSFAISVDDEPLPWLTRDGRVFTALTLPRPDLSKMDLALSVSPESCVDRDVSFSFRTIKVRALAAETSG